MGKFEPKDKMILIVDDDPEVLELIDYLLKREGFRTYTAKDGLMVNYIAKQLKVDLIIFDLMMPNIGGYEGIRNLQVQESTKDIPVIIATGRSMDKSLRQTLETEKNVKGFLKKPLEINSFISKVHESLSTVPSD